MQITLPNMIIHTDIIIMATHMGMELNLAQQPKKGSYCQISWVEKVTFHENLLSPVTQRHRSSPYPMLSVSEATQKILNNTPVLSVTSKPVDADLVGYILAEDVSAPESVPAFRASIVDGYAVICTRLLFPR